jgi:hypothetical protein
MSDIMILGNIQSESFDVINFLVNRILASAPFTVELNRTTSPLRGYL